MRRYSAESKNSRGMCLLGTQAVLQALQVDAVAAGGQGLDGHAIAPRDVVEAVQAQFQVAAPIPQRIDAVEGLGRQLGT